MVLSPKTTHHYRNYGNYAATCVLAVIAVLLPCRAEAQSIPKQSQGQADSATLQGSVRDSQGKPVAAATVYLKEASGTPTLNVRTDSVGIYHFSALREGVYTLRAEMAGH